MIVLESAWELSLSECHMWLLLLVAYVHAIHAHVVALLLLLLWEALVKLVHLVHAHVVALLLLLLFLSLTLPLFCLFLLLLLGL